MRRLTAALSFSTALLAAASSQAQTSASAGGIAPMEISRNGSRPPAVGSPQNFTGSVRVEPLFDARGPARASAFDVTFEPGARTAWHSHPFGQRLIVTSGLGWTQVEGGPVEEIGPGDVVWCPPNVRHWHGATATTAMTHIAVQEAKDGKFVEWMEHVTDAQYRAGQAR